MRLFAGRHAVQPSMPNLLTLNALPMYLVIDSQTGVTVGKAKTSKGAHRIADRKDTAYGAVRYYVKRAP